MNRPRLRLNHRTTWLIVGSCCIGLGSLPWLGLGAGYAFVLPGWNMALPRLDLFRTFDSRGFYDVVSFPLHLFALIPLVGDAAVFAGEGVKPVRPFMVFLFWHVIGCGFLWRGIRIRRKAV